MTDELSEEIRAEILKKIPLGEMGKPEEVAALVCYLASREAAYITGQVIAIDGGMTM
jgi:3-oxoacyl-[acyl-carrier protein] reductase